MKKLFLLPLLAFLPLLAHADPVEINGIYYNLITKSGANVAEVTSNPSKYSGDIVIPSSVEYNGTQYSVIKICDSAFYDCGSLTSITIPNSVTSIGSSAFSGCI